MKSDLSDDLLHYLEETGMSAQKIARCNRETRMWQDLKNYGEIAGDFLMDLSERHQIDLSQFESEKYYPDEAEGKNLISRILISLVPFLDSYLRDQKVYSPLTLGMIDDAIVSKRLT
jgi:Protein of unknown function (DUF1493)